LLLVASWVIIVVLLLMITTSLRAYAAVLLPVMRLEMTTAVPVLSAMATTLSTLAIVAGGAVWIRLELLLLVLLVRRS
jgi:hypothetical protein